MYIEILSTCVSDVNQYIRSPDDIAQSIVLPDSASSPQSHPPRNHHSTEGLVDQLRSKSSKNLDVTQKQAVQQSKSNEHEVENSCESTLRDSVSSTQSDAFKKSDTAKHSVHEDRSSTPLPVLK